MRVRVLSILLLFSSFLASEVLASGSDKSLDDQSQKTEQKISAKPDVTLSLCVITGSVTVRGWDRGEVVARSQQGAQIEFRRADNGADSTPAGRIQVLVIDEGDVLRSKRGCQASSDVDMSVPFGATVQVQTRDGDVNINGVATAYAGTQGGDIYLEHISRVVEVGTVSGKITVKDSTGRVDLNSVAGTVVVKNARPVAAADTFQITTVSGDLDLQQVGHSELSLRTVNGNLKLSGPLASGGRYGISTMSGDVVLAIPANSSFQLHAKVSSGADIITDFPLTVFGESPPAQPAHVFATPPRQPTPPPSAKGTLAAPPATSGPVPEPATAPTATPPTSKVIRVPRKVVKARVKDIPAISIYSLRRVSAICGTGDAVISLASFSGTLHLQKN